MTASNTTDFDRQRRCLRDTVRLVAWASPDALLWQDAPGFLAALVPQARTDPIANLATCDRSSLLVPSSLEKLALACAAMDVEKWTVAVPSHADSPVEAPPGYRASILLGMSKDLPGEPKGRVDAEFINWAAGSMADLGEVNAVARSAPGLAAAMIATTGGMRERVYRAPARGKPKAVLCATDHDRVCYVTWMANLPRARALAPRLLSRVLDRAVGRGCVASVLHIPEDCHDIATEAGYEVTETSVTLLTFDP